MSIKLVLYIFGYERDKQSPCFTNTCYEIDVKIFVKGLKDRSIVLLKQ